MLYAIGTKVRLIHTGDEGTVADWLDHGLVEVQLADGEIIPVDQASLERITAISESKAKAKVVPAKRQPEPLPIQPPDIGSQYRVLRPQGLQLAFDPVQRTDGITERYRIYLINDTQHHFLYQLELRLAKSSVWQTQGRLGPRTMVECGNLRYAELNNSPVTELNVWRQLPERQGTGGQLKRVLKIKANGFFSKLTTAPYLNRQVHLYSLFTPTELTAKKETPKKKPPPPSLKNYTAKQPKTKNWFSLQELPSDLLADAVFNNEIDLHLERLVDDPTTIPRGKILSTQLQYFREYMDQALQVGADRVFIIHGMGEGKLRDAVAKELQKMDFVRSFKNDYHPRYGFGATEVEL
ncbi:MAG: Smr/MutS family protein [Bacteroidota bacterium]